MKFWNNIAEKARDVLLFFRKILFPPRCVFCERTLEPNLKTRVCGNCSNDIEFCSDKVCCAKCGKPILGYSEKQLCYFCINEKKKYFKRIVSVFLYEGSTKKSIVKYKATGLSGHADVFTDCLAARIFEEYGDTKFDFLCGVPPHDTNKGFDHVGILCKRLSGRLGIPYTEDIFVKVRKTKKQSSLGYKERRENMKESLIVKPGHDVTGKTALLIDDICTTRSTIIECSRALKAAKAKNIYAATLATVKHPD